MSQIVSAVYATHADAEAARQALIVDGFEAAEVRITSLATGDDTTPSAQGGGVRGFFRSLFGLEPEHPEVERYVAAVDSGRTVVSIEVDDDEALAARTVLLRYGPVDLPPGEGYVTDTDRLRNGDAEPEYRTTMPFGESICAGAAGAAGEPGARPGTTPIPESETEARLATPPGLRESPALAPAVPPASVYEDPLLSEDPSRTQPFVPVVTQRVLPDPLLDEPRPTDLYAARDASIETGERAADAVYSGAAHEHEPVLAPDALDEGISHAPGLEETPPTDPASVVGGSIAEDQHEPPHTVPPLAPIVPPVAPIAAQHQPERRRQPR